MLLACYPLQESGGWAGRGDEIGRNSVVQMARTILALKRTISSSVPKPRVILWQVHADAVEDF